MIRKSKPMVAVLFGSLYQVISDIYSIGKLGMGVKIPPHPAIYALVFSSHLENLEGQMSVR